MFRIETIGNLGGDAEVKNDNGRLYVQFSVADTRKFKKEDGTVQETTNWISCFYRNAESEVVKYLKKGTRVFVRGNGDLRLFSSAKDRMMKAGVSINVQEIELVGGLSDPVPRELALPTGQIVPVNKCFWIDVTQMAEKPTTAYDRRGNPYTLDGNGFVVSYPNQATQEADNADQDQPADGRQEPTADNAPAKPNNKAAKNNVKTVEVENADGSKSEIS